MSLLRISSSVFLASLIGLVACSDDGNLGGSSSGGSSSGGASSSSGGASSSSGGASSSSGGAVTTEEVTGDITADRTLTANKRWLLKGLVSVKPGATLTIEKGTTIVGDTTTKAILLVEAGAKIMAQGTADEPIVFTSPAAPGVRRAGDWGGIVILGNAPVNFTGGKGNIEGILKTVKGTEYGGANADDSSGVLSYIRIEYSGILLSPDNEVNGLTFGGVGRGTKVDHIQVRHTLDDCFEFFGGNVDAKYLACQYNEDDGFDFDNGFQGRLQFLVLQQDPMHAGEDNGFESDNDAQGSANQPMTAPQVYNATLIGKGTPVDNVQYGMLLRKNTRGTYANVVVSGFDAALDVRDAATAAGVTTPEVGMPALSVKSTIFWGSHGQGVLEHVAFPETGAASPDKDNDNGFDELGWFKTPGSNNFVKDPGLKAPYDAKVAGFGPNTSLTEGATTPPADGFFDASATYIGAFKDANDNWATAGKWAVWDAE
jgi:hypothetical protein